MIRALLVSASDLGPELGGTILFRRNVERQQASRPEEVRRIVEEGRLDVVVVDSALPAAAEVVAALRQDPVTRATAIVVLGRSEFGFRHLDLLEAGANAILPLPPDHDWDDRLTRLIHVPARRATRLDVGMAIEGGLMSGLSFAGWALNISVHGLLVESPQPLQVGEDLRLCFEVPGAEEVVKGTGTVVRIEAPHLFGVEFTHVEAEGRFWIKRFVESGGPD